MADFPLRYPDAAQHFESPHHWGDWLGGAQREFVVEHIMAGRIWYLDKMAQTPEGLDNGNRVSVHFGIAGNGDVHQYLDLNLSCWGAGRIDDPKAVMQKFGVKLYQRNSGKYNGNLGSIQIEHEGTPNYLSYAPKLAPWGPDNPLPEAMIEASLKLQEWLVNEGVVKPNFLDHRNLTPSQRPNDPGAEVDKHIVFPLRKRDWTAGSRPAPGDHAPDLDDAVGALETKLENAEAALTARVEKLEAQMQAINAATKPGA